MIFNPIAISINPKALKKGIGKKQTHTPTKIQTIAIIHLIKFGIQENNDRR
jgi:hypothetical protein